MSHPKSKRDGVASRRNGRTMDRVICGACGHTNRFYRWSWAGNGKAKCAGCGRWIMYSNLNTEETTTLPPPPRPPIQMDGGIGS